MPRHLDSARIDLAQIFLRVQHEMLACLAVGEAFEHPTTCGSASEQHWIALFNRYLPQRYRASPAFVVDADGRRSRQIDLAIYDNLYSPLIFPHESGLHLAAESVYAVRRRSYSAPTSSIKSANVGLGSDSIGAATAGSSPVLLPARAGIVTTGRTEKRASAAEAKRWLPCVCDYRTFLMKISDVHGFDVVL